jgi:uncharacterized protein YycO
VSAAPEGSICIPIKGLPDDVAKVIEENGGDVKKVIKFTKRDGKVVWLETGDDRSGWQHLLERHEQDFYNKFGNIGNSGIRDKIIEAIDKGVYRQEVVIKDGVERITNVYEYNNVRVNVSGRNGYIISSNPY